jgi:hypothetical protein
MSIVHSVSLAATLCWADPRGDGEAGLTWSARAGAHQAYYLHCTAFGPDSVERFCRNNDLDCIVRGHEVAIKVRRVRSCAAVATISRDVPSSWSQQLIFMFRISGMEHDPKSAADHRVFRHTVLWD